MHVYTTNNIIWQSINVRSVPDSRKCQGSKAENVLLVPTTYALKKNEVIHIFVLVGSN